MSDNVPIYRYSWNGVDFVETTEEKSPFIKEEDRPQGFFHVIPVDGIIGRRKGIVVEKSEQGLTWAIHLILFVSGTSKRRFEIDFRRSSIMDYPLYWVRFTWSSRIKARIARSIWGNLSMGFAIPRFEVAYGLTGESLH